MLILAKAHGAIIEHASHVKQLVVSLFLFIVQVFDQMEDWIEDCSECRGVPPIDEL
mgnify:FL=1